MSVPEQIKCKDWLPTGIFGIEAGSAQVLDGTSASDASTVFDADEATAILLVSDGVRYEVGATPTASATTHLAIAPAMTLRIEAGQKIAVFGGEATVSVVE